VARLAKDRDTHLTRDEIAREALRQFDAGDPPSIRSLAARLKVAPTAIYHHFPSIAAIHDAVVELVWTEALALGMVLVPDPAAAEPAEVLVAAGLATRRAFVAHPGAAAHLAATTESSQRLNENLELLAGTFARLGLTGDEAAVAFHTYASFTIGSVLFVTARAVAGPTTQDRQAPGRPVAARDLTGMIRLSFEDPRRDEELFELGLRRLVAGLANRGAVS
jgi:AcrR family transcriptional regulator